MSISTSDLDFANIKNKLKTYLKQGDFADYDFEASGLSSILDVLAYNTHLNGLIANMAINESFLTSAQLRSSVLAHAESLGYAPKSATAATAIVTASVSGVVDGPELLILDEGTEFVTDIDEVSYSFKSTEVATAVNDNGTYIFTTASGSTNITVREGVPKRKRFVVGDASDGQVFVIPDTNIDTTTLRVSVYDNFNTTEFTVFNNIDQVTTINDDSTIYLIREAANGQYELQFSDGNTLGRSPVAGNKIVVTYVTTIGEEANGGNNFLTKNLSFNSETYPVVVGLVAESSGGSGKESIESIKLYAPKSYATQQRLVTAEDYESIIMRSFSTYLDGIVAWGGNENIPPQYGKVFVSLQFKNGIDEVSQGIIKDTIKSQLTSNLSIMSIDTEFVDPKETLLELNIAFNSDPTKSGSSVAALQTQIKVLVANHFEQNLSTFSSIFRRSTLLTKIDNLSPAILNSRMDVRAQQRIENIVVGQNKDYSTAFPFTLANPDKDDHTIKTSIFRYNGQNVYIKNELGSTRLQVFDLNNNIKVVNAGSYTPANGLVSINGLNIESNTILKISVTPANQSTLKPLRNYIISLDDATLDATGTLESGSTKVVL